MKKRIIFWTIFLIFAGISAIQISRVKAYEARNTVMYPILDYFTFRDLGQGYAISSYIIYYKGVAAIRQPNDNYWDTKVLDAHHLLTTHHVYYNDQILEGADPKTFDVIDDRLAKDSHSVFLDEKKIDFLDAKTFQVLNDFFVKDDSGVYLFPKQMRSSAYRFLSYKLDENNRIVDADPKSFNVLAGPYGRDKSHIYFFNRRLENADKDLLSFTGKLELLDEVYQYMKSGRYVYYMAQKIDGADPATFVLYDSKYFISLSKDKNNVYSLKGDQVVAISGLDSETFRVLSRNYGVDKNNIYYQHKPIENVDLQPFLDMSVSFKELSSSENYDAYPNYLTDGKYVYYLGRKLVGVDLSSFTSLGKEYSKDNKHVYYQHHLVEGADPNTFNASRYAPFYQDAKRMYIQGQAILNSDLQSFKQRVEKTLYDDDHNIYLFKGKELIIKTKSDNVKILSNRFVLMENQLYILHNSRITLVENYEIDSPTLEVLDKYYLKDKNHVYYTVGGNFQIIKGADAKTFELIDREIKKDKQNIYYIYNGEQAVLNKHGVDVPTFKSLNPDLALFYADKNHVYARSSAKTFITFKGLNPNKTTYNRKTRKLSDGKKTYNIKFSHQDSYCKSWVLPDGKFPPPNYKGGCYCNSTKEEWDSSSIGIWGDDE